MNPASGVLLSLAYIVGLLLTASLDSTTRSSSWQELGVLLLGIFVLGIVGAIAIPQFWRKGPTLKQWLTAGLIAAIAPLYFQARVPQPTSNDISQFVRSTNGTVQEQVVTVQGKVQNVPHLTRSSKGQFWLEAKQLNEVESSNQAGVTSKGVTGKLYVTVPVLQATGLYPGQSIAVTGVLYKPKSVSNPGAFDFKAYLAREGTFAGFSGRQVSETEEQQARRWGRWVLQERIVRSQVRWLGSPVGTLVSSMALGSRAVDVPYEIRDQFIQSGLAHALAASGTQTSLILGFVLVVTKRLSVKAQLVCGTIALGIFVFLTGLQASVLRAAIMGFGALIALVTQRKVKPVGSLLVAATLLLIFNPLWIWDLGFQLSFLATLGLLVTVPPLLKRLDWLPPAIASLIAIPLAAALWTLPLQLYVFGMVAPYSTAVNILCAPLIALISLCGIISALAALIIPPVGSALAWLLNYPTLLLIAIVKFFNRLPGSSVAVGTISLWQLLLIYGLIGISSIGKKLQRRWWLVVLVALSLITLPVWQAKAALFRVTVLAAAQEQVLVIQDHGQVTLVNSGEEDTAQFTVLPFLQKQGINEIDWAIALDLQPRLRSGWLQVLESLPVKAFYDSADSSSSAKTQGKDEIASASAIANAVQSQQGNYQPVLANQTISVSSTPIQLLNTQPAVLQLQIQQQIWLLLGEVQPDIQKQLANTDKLPQAQVLLWTGESLLPELLTAVQPKVAIASSSKTVDIDTAQLLRKAKIPLYWTGRDGAIQWTANSGFETTLETTNNDASLL